MLILRVFKELVNLQVKLFDRDKGLLDGDDELAKLEPFTKNDLIDNCVHNPGTWQFAQEWPLIKKDGTEEGKLFLKIKFIDESKKIAKRLAEQNNQV